VVTVTVCVRPSPSVAKISGLAKLVEATPERLSVVVKGIETFVLFHPAGLGDGIGDPNINVGGVLSMFTFTEVVAEFPALSVAEPLII